MALLTYACKNRSGSSWSISADRIDRSLLERQIKIGASEVRITIGQASMVCSAEDLRRALAAADGPSRLGGLARKAVVGVLLILLGVGVGAAGIMAYTGLPAATAGERLKPAVADSTEAASAPVQQVAPTPTPTPRPRPQQTVVQRGPTARATEAYWRRVNDICSASMDRGTKIASDMQQSSVYDSPQVKQIKGFIAMAAIRPEVQKAAMQVQALSTAGVAPVLVEAARARAAFNVAMMDSMAQMGNRFAANPSMNDAQSAALVMQWMADMSILSNQFNATRDSAFREVQESMGLDLTPIKEKNAD